MLLLREELEKREVVLLSPLAKKSIESKGRDSEEEKCRFRTDFQRDRDRILHSKAFRRLIDKTQVFLSPDGDHFRTRLTHTLEVSQISRTVARALGLNEDLTEAIALGHDLGHTPFGHSGEEVLNDVHPEGFKHNIQSLRVVEVLESNESRSRGLNLTFEVRDGILNHTGKGIPVTLEGQIVKICDRVAYINHDIDDGIRAGVIGKNALPTDCVDYFGDNHRKRINTMVEDLINNSDGKSNIVMSDGCFEMMMELRTFMFETVYYNVDVKKMEDLTRVDATIRTLYHYYISNPDKLPEEFTNLIKEFGVPEIVKDYVAGMTDNYAMSTYKEIIQNK